MVAARGLYHLHLNFVSSVDDHIMALVYKEHGQGGSETSGSYDRYLHLPCSPFFLLLSRNDRGGSSWLRSLLMLPLCMKIMSNAMMVT